ncbi:MAG: DUF484 family protein [Gallionella sp.]|nr:DUF484 family protein [Gallionella sp.]
MKPEAVAQYLRDNPYFFDDHIETLTQIQLPHPHGGRTISLSERQLVALRDKNKDLEKKLREMIAYAQENEALQHKVHEFVIALFGARDLATLQDMIPYMLRDIFAVPHVAMHLWQTNPPSEAVLMFADTENQPICTHNPVEDTATWFGEHAAQLRSYAYMTLHAGSGTIGMLVLASEDKERFYPEMGTMFLQRISEVVSSALHPYLAD